MRRAAMMTLIALSCSSVLAAEWRPTVRSKSGAMQYFIETTSAVRQGDSIRVWMRGVIDQPPPGKPVMTVQESVWFKCNTMEWAVVSVFVYIGADDSGELVESKKWPMSEDRFAPIRPGTDRYTIAEYLCAKDLPRF
jgi:hypothetical protein